MRAPGGAWALARLALLLLLVRAGAAEPHKPHATVNFKEADWAKLSSFLTLLEGQLQTEAAAAAKPGGVQTAAVAELGGAATQAKLLREQASALNPKTDPTRRAGGAGIATNADFVARYDAFSLKLAAFLASKATADVIRAKPTVFSAVSKPPAPRPQLCADAQKMNGLSQKAKDCMCNAAQPFIVCQAMMQMDLLPKLNALLEKAKGVLPSPPTPAVASAFTNASAAAAGTVGASLIPIGPCSIKGMIGRGDTCVGGGCKITFKKIVAIKIEAEACIPNYLYTGCRLKTCKIQTCPKKSGRCTTKEVADYKLVQEMTQLAEKTRYTVEMGLCLDVPVIADVLEKIGVEVCIIKFGFTVWPVKEQIEGYFKWKASLFAGNLRGKIQLEDGKNTMACRAVRDLSLKLYEDNMQCKDYCALNSGEGSLWLDLTIGTWPLTKTYNIPITSAGNTPYCGTPLRPADNSGNSWGDWTKPMDVPYCPRGSWASGVQVRVEGDQGGSGDDTALNAVSFMCSDNEGFATESIMPHPGFWGGWGPWVNCPKGEHINGIQMKTEPDQGGGDDTSANAIKIFCTGGASFVASPEMPWGDWGEQITCPNGMVAAGAVVRVEDSQGGDDDTALNSVALQCQTRTAPMPRVPVLLSQRRKAYQSSVKPGSNGLPARAVDGRTSGVWKQGTCTQTRSQFKPWFYVDLGKPNQLVDYVKIWQRCDGTAGSLRDLVIHVTDTVPFPAGAPSPRRASTLCKAARGPQRGCGRGKTSHYNVYVCKKFLYGRYVSIQISNNSPGSALSMCEVQVYGADMKLQLLGKSNQGRGYADQSRSSGSFPGFPLLGEDPYEAAQRVIDGKTKETCMQSEPQNYPRWWVHMPNAKVHRVGVWTHCNVQVPPWVDPSTARLHDIAIVVDTAQGYSHCATAPGPQAPCNAQGFGYAIYTCQDGPLLGGRVEIQSMDSNPNTILVLCEVDIWGVPNWDR